VIPKQTVWVGLVALLVALVCPTVGGAGCDDKCRMRNNFFLCTLTTCVYMERADCGKCTAAMSACDTANPASPGTCQQQGTNTAYNYTGCNLDCDCSSTIWTVEAQNGVFPVGTPIERPWMRCLVEEG
jgi:hypothetical protein